MKPEFEEKARQIFRLIRRYDDGKLFVNPATGRYDSRAHLRVRHASFARAQDGIVAELLSIALRRRDLNAEIKNARRSRNKDDERALLREEMTLDYREAIIRKLADSIAWQLIGGRKDIAQYLYIRESPPSIDQSNFESVKEEVDRLNQSDSTTFALVSDLTSFVQIGDILAWGPGGLRVIEVKEGEFSAKAIQIAGEMIEDDKEPDVGILSSELGRHSAKHVDRVYRQMLRGSRAEEIINTGKGYDPETGRPAIVQEPGQIPVTYELELTKLVSEQDKRLWAYTVLEDCLMIGCYSGVWRKAGRHLLQELSARLYGRQYPFVDLRAGLEVPMADPIFLKPLTEGQIFDVVFGRTCVFMIINLDRLLDMFSRRGVNARWLPRKETARLRNEWRGGGLLVFDNRAIVIQHEESSIYLTDAALSRIVFDNMLPSSLVTMFSNDPLAS